MIVVYCFYPGDIDLALKNARWINELGGCKEHELLAAFDPRCDPGKVEMIRQELGKSFLKLHKCPALDEIDGWPEGANYFFRIITTWLQDKQQWPYFFWMEPDAIPLTPGWLDKLEAEYKRAGKPFMGDRVQVEDIPLHMSGVGIYQNPIYMLAGEAYRAYDVAWDMASKDQVVPNAHFTNLIEHAWRHPQFHDRSEIQTQISPETILFHSSKDGSLIDLLRNENIHRTRSTHPAADQDEALQSSVALAASGGSQRDVSPRSQETQGFPGSSRRSDTQGSSARENDQTADVRQMQVSGVGETTPRPSQGLQQPVESGVAVRDVPLATPQRTSPDIIYDIFIRTYPGDYYWLDYCLKSIETYASGFRKIWIVSPNIAPPIALPQNAEWKVMNDETEDGYLAQQITKCYADAITDYQADYILHVDSDVIFQRAVTPGDFFTGEKLTWFYTPYQQIETPWQPIMEKFMGFTMPYEFMRRLPMMLPRWLYPKLREFCHHQHGMIISEYIRTQPQRAFSEFNALGCYAYFNHPDKFQWISTASSAMPEPFSRQFHSWGGLTPEIKNEIEGILGGMGERPQDAPPVPTQIKVLDDLNVWVLHGDQISQWVEQEGRLDHDQNLLPDILKHIRPGDIVVDAGAFIGDHTVAYSHAVGEEGIVHAFEPNPLAYKCLCHNLENLRNVVSHSYGLGEALGIVPLSGNNGNWGGAYVGEHMKITDVRVRALETEVPWRINFIKIDVEGYELKVLRGAGNLINRCRPKMVIEINSGALQRQGATPDDIFGWLAQHDYDWTIIQKNCLRNDPLYDILCIPKQPPEKSLDAPTSQTASTPVAPLTLDTVKDYVYNLKKFAELSPKNKWRVNQYLVYAGFKPPNDKKKWKSSTKHRKPRGTSAIL